MSDFLTNLASRSLGTKPAIQPRLASLYEPLPAADSKIITGALFEARDADAEEPAAASHFDSSLPFGLQPAVPSAPAATTTQTPRVEQGPQANDAAGIFEASDQPGEILRQTESKSGRLGRPRETAAKRTREEPQADVTELMSSDPVVPTPMVQSLNRIPSPHADLTLSPSAESTDVNSQAALLDNSANARQKTFEGVEEQRIAETPSAGASLPPPAPRSQIVASPAIGPEETIRSAPAPLARGVTIERAVPAGVLPSRVVSAADLLTPSTPQKKAAADEDELTAREIVPPVTIKRIVPASESPAEVVSAGAVSVTSTPTLETAAAEEAAPRHPDQTPQPLTIDRVAPASESPRPFATVADLLVTGRAVPEPPSTEKARVPFTSPVVSPLKIERVAATSESPRPSVSAAELSPSRPTVPTMSATLVVQPQSIFPARPLAPTLAEPPAPELNVQVTIGRIEIRAIKTPEAQPKDRRATQSTLMSLDDYLRQRAQGGKQ